MVSGPEGEPSLSLAEASFKLIADKINHKNRISQSLMFSITR